MLTRWFYIFQQMSRLDLNGLLDLNIVRNDEKMRLHLKFAHVHKERKYREYFFDDEEHCEVSVLISPCLLVMWFFWKYFSLAVC